MSSPQLLKTARPTHSLDPATVQAQLDRILVSRTFATAKSATRFLRYVVEETLAGRADQIKEYVVGTAVFERGDAFDPRTDAVVRVEATRLRNRLRDYYLNEGLDDTVSIELPKGSYVPLFRTLQLELPAEPPPSPLHLVRGVTVWIAAVTVLLLIVTTGWWVRSRMLSLTQVQSIAVLPFEDSSRDGSQEYLADGITDRLTNELGHLRTLRVLSHSAVIGYSHLTKSRSAVATDLKVDAWVEGSVSRYGNRVTITERLLHTATSRILWSQSYTSNVNEVPALQSQSARSLASAIGVEWASNSKGQSDILRVNAEAFDYYLRGRFHSQRQTEAENQTAIEDLQRAVSIDSSFASAYAELAQAYVWRLFLFAPNEKQWEEKAYVAAERSLALDPDLAAAHVARGRLLWTPSNHFAHEKAIREYRRALDSDPTLDEARNQLALIYCHIGFFDQALQEARQATLTNPNNSLAVYRIAQTLAFRGQYEESLATLRGIPEEVQPSLVGYQTSWALFNLGKKDEAKARVAALLRRYPEDSGGLFHSVQAVLAASDGDQRTTSLDVKLAIEKGRNFGHFHHTAYHIATAFALAHKPEEAVKWLEAAAEDGFPCYPLFATDHNLDNLRQNSTFIDFIERQKQQWAAYKRLF